jgi:endo-1,4-beta-xylanase
VRTLLFNVFTLTIGLVFTGCASEEPSEPGPSIGGTTAAGGASSGVGGSSVVTQPGGGLGGKSATSGPTTIPGTTAQGGSPEEGGATSSSGGATEAVGGKTSATGGSKATWTTGSKASGGTTSANTTGKTTGGTTSVGGSKSTGGSSPVAGSTSVGGSTSPVSVEKFVGNITTGNNSVDTGGLKYATYWNQITPENSGKWGSVQSSPTSNFNWTSLDSVYDYCEKNKIIFKQHVFIWGSQQPNPAGNITEAQVKAWMKGFCDRYPNTKVIDVVNEPPPHTTPGYANNIGGGTNGTWAWITNAFKWAREACPNAILILNDYNTIEWTNDSSHFISIVKTIKAAGAPIDAVGAQAHDLDHASVSVSTVKKLVADLNTQTGLPVYITELDLSYTDDAKQLDMYKQYMPFFMEQEYIKGITIWGWIYGSTWSQAPDSGLVKNGKSRPAMTYIMDLLKRPAP